MTTGRRGILAMCDFLLFPGFILVKNMGFFVGGFPQNNEKQSGASSSATIDWPNAWWGQCNAEWNAMDDVGGTSLVPAVARQQLNINNGILCRYLVDPFQVAAITL